MSEVHFVVEAEGKNLTYQWLKNDEPLVDSKKYEGGVNSTRLTIQDVDKTDEGYYRCEVWSGNREWLKEVSHPANLSLGKHSYASLVIVQWC